VIGCPPVGGQGRFEERHERIRIAGLTLPDRDYSVAPRPKIPHGLRVAFSILSELPFPKFAVALGHGRELATIVVVPETTMDKYCPLLATVRDVRGTGQVTVLHTIPMAECMQLLAHQDLGPSISLTNPPHSG
jgi:hypothetical protein